MDSPQRVQAVSKRGLIVAGSYGFGRMSREGVIFQILTNLMVGAHSWTGFSGVGPENSVHRRKAKFRSKEGRILESGYAYRVAAIKGQNIAGEIGG